MEYNQDHQQRRRHNQGRGYESALYEVVCPAIYVIRVFGLAPYAYPKDNRPPKLLTSNFNCIYTVAWITIYSYIVVTSLIRFEGLDRNKPVLGVTENGKVYSIHNSFFFYYYYFKLTILN